MRLARDMAAAPTALATAPAVLSATVAVLSSTANSAVPHKA